MHELFHELTVTSLDHPDESIVLNVADEVPVRLLFNGIFPYGVMMMTPDHLEDFVFGFCLTEEIVRSAAQIRSVVMTAGDDGPTLDVRIDGECLTKLLRRRPRAQTGHSSCGICGIDDVPSLHTAETTRFPEACTITTPAVHRALGDLDQWQELNARTHMVHAAAWADRDGRIQLIREDVGRHNALDKLIGARMRDSSITVDGICLLTSRYSFEMALKTVRAGMDVVVAVSAPTYRAFQLAEGMQQTLIAIARRDRQIIFCGEKRVAR